MTCYGLITLGWTSCLSTGWSDPSLGFARTLHSWAPRDLHGLSCAASLPPDKRVSKGSILAGMLRSPSVRDVLSRRHLDGRSPGFSRSGSSGEKGMVMSETTDPPSDEQKNVGFRGRLRGLCRTLVNRKTLLMAIQVILGIVRIVQFVAWMLGGF